MAKVVHLDDLGINLSSSLADFISALAKCQLEKGTFFSGTVAFSDRPSQLVQGEVQGVIGYIVGDLLIDMTLTSVEMPNRWTCSYRTGAVNPPKWIERK
jgi:hypothetical protein